MGDLSLLADVTPWCAAVALLVGALASLDETAFAQTWLGQPLPAAALCGLLLGEPAVGLAIGVPFQLAVLGNLPVGRSFLGDQAGPLPGAVAAAAATGFLAGAERSSLLSPDAIAGRVGWLLLLLALASLIGHRIVKAERAWHVRMSTGILRSLRDGGAERLERAQLRCLAVTALRGALVSGAVMAVALLFWIPAYDLLAERLQRACALLAWCTPALALGALSDLYASRAGVRWLAGACTAVLILLWAVAWRGAA